MKRAGTAYLPLHGGRAPRWLVNRMIRLADGIVTVIIDEYGRREFLRRISDPYWFQALSCCLGYDWHSSGTTTVVTAVLKNVLKPEEHGMIVCGGKGKTSMKTLDEIDLAGEVFNLPTDTVERLKYASRMSAKVDNAAIQDGYSLYHHAFFLAEDGEWAVIQQGMSVKDRTARRYHWLSDHVRSFVAEPHEAIVGDVKRRIALDMTAKESEECRKVSVDVARDDPRKVARMLKSIRPHYQRSLKEWIGDVKEEASNSYVIEFLSMPLTINWKALKRVYEFQPRNYEELLGVRGVGPATVRGLALISEIIYGEKPSWRDPVKFSFAFGGKDGVPYPVDRRAMDRAIRILRDAIEKARLGDKERLRSLKRLRRFVPPDIEA